MSDISIAENMEFDGVNSDDESYIRRKSMAQIIVNPDELRNFAAALEQYVTNIDEETGRIGSAFNVLGETWKDDKHAQFENDFNELQAQITAFKNMASEYAPYLYSLAASLDPYSGR